MTKQEIFSIWSPDDSPWSPWVKPVLFAHADSPLSEIPVYIALPDVSWVPLSAGKTAVVLDLPGAEGVLAAIALAGRGYRPVPLYNAVPLPFGHAEVDELSGRPVAAVNLVPVVAALRQTAETLSQLKLSPAAPPVFLLDANRRAEGRIMRPEEFDNRSVSLTTDFPSTNFLVAHGIERVILVQRDRTEPQPDLAHTLRRWQDGGLTLERKQMNSTEPPESFQVSRPPWYGFIFQRVLSTFGLQRSAGGGFGAWMPEESAGG